MFDDRRMRQLEIQVDALRTNEKDSESRKTYDEVFDHAALLTIADLITDGVISTLDYPVSTGKEANVFHATGPDGRAKAVKIYRIANATFRNIAVYIDGDPRFKRVKRATRPTLLAWAQKEYKNLVRMEDAGARVPTPERVHNNLLVMEYIGDETRPAPALREIALEDPAAVYADVVTNLRAIRKAELVHADMSEYNLLWWSGRVVVIDVGQAVPLDHPRAAERIGVLIGAEGTTKERLQHATGTRISVDSASGEVTIDEADAQDPVLALKARDVVQAMARGFSEDRAFRLLDEDAYFEVLDIKDFAHSKNRVAQIRARLIGTRGKTRRLIEELTGVEVSVWGHTIALIGGTFEMAIAREAVFMLLRGSEHKTVYRFLERKRADIKVYQMGF